MHEGGERGHATPSSQQGSQQSSSLPPPPYRLPKSKSEAESNATSTEELDLKQDQPQAQRAVVPENETELQDLAFQAKNAPETDTKFVPGDSGSEASAQRATEEALLKETMEERNENASTSQEHTENDSKDHDSKALRGGGNEDSPRSDNLEFPKKDQKSERHMTSPQYQKPKIDKDDAEFEGEVTEPSSQTRISSQEQRQAREAGGFSSEQNPLQEEVQSPKTTPVMHGGDQQKEQEDLDVEENMSQSQTQEESPSRRNENLSEEVQQPERVSSSSETIEPQPQTQEESPSQRTENLSEEVQQPERASSSSETIEPQPQTQEESPSRPSATVSEEIQPEIASSSSEAQPSQARSQFLEREIDEEPPGLRGMTETKVSKAGSTSEASNPSAVARELLSSEMPELNVPGAPPAPQSSPVHGSEPLIEFKDRGVDENLLQESRKTSTTSTTTSPETVKETFEEDSKASITQKSDEELGAHNVEVANLQAEAMDANAESSVQEATTADDTVRKSDESQRDDSQDPLQQNAVAQEANLSTGDLSKPSGKKKVQFVDQVEGISVNTETGREIMDTEAKKSDGTMKSEIPLNPPKLMQAESADFSFLDDDVESPRTEETFVVPSDTDASFSSAPVIQDLISSEIIKGSAEVSTVETDSEEEEVEEQVSDDEVQHRNEQKESFERILESEMNDPSHFGGVATRAPPPAYSAAVLESKRRIDKVSQKVAKYQEEKGLLSQLDDDEVKNLTKLDAHFTDDEEEEQEFRKDEINAEERGTIEQVVVRQESVNLDGSSKEADATLLDELDDLIEDEEENDQVEFENVAQKSISNDVGDGSIKDEAPSPTPALKKTGHGEDEASSEGPKASSQKLILNDVGDGSIKDEAPSPTPALKKTGHGGDEASSEEPKASSGRDPGNEPSGELETFALWLELIHDRFYGPASKVREAEMENSIVSSKNPLEHPMVFSDAQPTAAEIARPRENESLNTTSRLGRMRRAAENAALIASKRRQIIQSSSRASSMAMKIAHFVQILRLADDEHQSISFNPSADDLEESSAIEVAMGVVRTKSWDALFSAFGIGNMYEEASSPTARADDTFANLLERQIRLRGSANGELIRQYLNVVLHGLPASPPLLAMVKKIPMQNAALSYTAYPQCEFLLGKISSQFRRIFCCMYEGLFSAVPGKVSEQERKQHENALRDLSAFMSTLMRCILFKYPPLFNCKVRDVVGDISEGRVQDSRRGGDLPRRTSDARLVIRTCIEDAVIDPVIDNLYLAFNAFHADDDRELAQLFMELKSSRSEEDLMKICGIPEFFRIGFSSKSQEELYGLETRREGPSPYQRTIDLLERAWITARTPSSKIYVLSLAHQSIVDTVIEHYSRPTYILRPDGRKEIQPTIKDQNKLIPRRREMLAIFKHCVIQSAPINMESQSRLIFELGSRHALAHSEVAQHVVAMICMIPKAIRQLKSPSA